MVDCPVIFTDYLINCFDEIQVNTQLRAGVYSWVIKDKFQKEYWGDIDLDSSGGFAIPLTSLPDGLFTPYSGDFTLQVYDACSPIPFQLAEFAYQNDYYDIVQFCVKDGGPYSYKNNIGC